MAIESQIITDSDANVAIVEWFEKLGKYCASVDYDSARAIFAADVLSFGTRADIVSGLEPLQSNQWEGIWPNIQDFKINLDTIHSDGDLPCPDISNPKSCPYISKNPLMTF